MISVLVAWVIGTVELLQVLSAKLGLSGAFWSWLGGLDFEMVGFGIIFLFVASWAVSFAYWRYKKYDKLEPLKPL